MALTIIVNSRTVVHKDSNGMATALPDVCKTPAPPAPPVPIPYPNIAKSGDTDKGSKKVKLDTDPIMLKNNSMFSTSVGDEAGTLKGIVSNTNKGVAKFANYSFNVKIEDKNVPRLGDPMLSNGNLANTTTVAELQAAMVISPEEWAYDINDDEVELICEAVCECKDATQWGYAKKQDCVSESLTSGPPQFNQKYENIHTEQPYNLTTSPPSLITSVGTGSGGRTTLGGAPTGTNLFRGLNMGRQLGGGNTCRPDIVLTHNNSVVAQGGNIRQVVEVKFEGDSLSRNQWSNYNSLNPSGPPPLVLEEKHCKCK